MTVKEMIEKLKEFPENENVYILDDHGVHVSISGVEKDGMKAIVVFSD